MRQNFVAQFVQLLKPWLCDVQSGIAVDKNWAHSVDQCRLQALQFSVHLINLLSILSDVMVSLEFRKLSRIRRAADHQTVTIALFFSASLALGRVSELLLGLATELVFPGCCIKATFHHVSQSDQEMVHCCCLE